MQKRKFIYIFVITALLLCGCSRQNTRVPDNSPTSESTEPSTTVGTNHTTESTVPDNTAESTVPGHTSETNHTAESTVPHSNTDVNNTGVPSESGTVQNHTGTADTISEDDAKQIALDQIPGASVQDIREFKTDYDNGKLQYEGKIYFEEKEYEFEIDAYTGTILEWDVDSINNNTRG